MAPITLLKAAMIWPTIDFIDNIDPEGAKLSYTRPRRSSLILAKVLKSTWYPCFRDATISVEVLKVSHWVTEALMPESQGSSRAETTLTLLNARRHFRKAIETIWYCQFRILTSSRLVDREMLKSRAEGRVETSRMEESICHWG